MKEEAVAVGGRGSGNGGCNLSSSIGTYNYCIQGNRQSPECSRKRQTSGRTTAALWFVLTGRSRALRDEGGGPFSLMHPGAWKPEEAWHGHGMRMPPSTTWVWGVRI